MGLALAPECLLLDPSRDQASSTNQISMLVSDDGKPSLSATQAFGVRVGDYLEIGLGSAVIACGRKWRRPAPSLCQCCESRSAFHTKNSAGRPPRPGTFRLVRCYRGCCRSIRGHRDVVVQLYQPGRRSARQTRTDNRTTDQIPFHLTKDSWKRAMVVTVLRTWNSNLSCQLGTLSSGLRSDELISC